MGLIVRGKTKDERTRSIIRAFGLDKIPSEEIRRQYVLLYPIVSNMGYGGNFRVFKGEMIKEEANSTLSIEETKTQICYKFKLENWQFKSTKVCNDVEIALIFPTSKNNTDLIIGAMESCGWSFSTSDDLFIDGMRWTCISFEPIFDKDISAREKRYPFLYHWSPFYNYDSIKKFGLLPKSESEEFKYPNWVHLIKGNSSDTEELSIGRQLYKKNTNEKNDGRYLMISVDCESLSKDIEIFPDPRYEWGVYTKKPILKDALIFLYGYNFSNQKYFSIE